MDEKCIRIWSRNVKERIYVTNSDASVFIILRLIFKKYGVAFN